MPRIPLLALAAVMVASIGANATPVPRMPLVPFLTVLIAFVVAIALWAVRLKTAFRVAR